MKTPHRWFYGVLGINRSYAMTNTFVLVGCGKAKRDEPTEAQNLYTSPYFACKRKFAKHADGWGVISAEHGLLEPTKTIEPYDTVVTELDAGETSVWADTICLDIGTMDIDHLIILAGTDYVTPLLNKIESWGFNFTVHTPFQSRDDLTGMFSQQSWLSDSASEMAESDTDVLDVL